MHASYTPEMTMRAARDRYFDVNGFGADGGYADTWVDFKLGPLPLPFPNTAGRIAAVKFHDLHHVLTGYETNATGEFEISAWELGAGCGSFPAAWVINHGGLAAGLVSAPAKVFTASCAAVAVARSTAKPSSRSWIGRWARCAKPSSVRRMAPRLVTLRRLRSLRSRAS